VAERKIPEPTPEQIELIMVRLLREAGRSQQTLFRIGKKAGVFWTHRGCSSPKSINMLTDERCIHCGAPRPAGEGPS
jgi:hypothetical protein